VNIGVCPSQFPIEPDDLVIPTVRIVVSLRVTRAAFSILGASAFGQKQERD
jgi:hypothetical protein